MDYLNQLNKAQQEAVINFNGPALVIAGAGSGKTRVLTYRVTHLLKQGIPAGSILALTFTNKAAREMKERILQIVGPDIARALWMGTFHSIFARILRMESGMLGYPSNYTIYDTVDSKNVIKGVIHDLDLDNQVYRINEVYNRISSAKNNLITAQAYAGNNEIVERDKLARTPRLSEIYKFYSARCYKSGAMDFDDLLLNMNILLRDFPEVLKKYQEHFKYILVDEYQDTNFSQYVIINKLASVHKNVCVVGDDAQSIYSFRGARIENILNFRIDYPDYRIFKLEQNYRSTQTIVNAANSLIDKNQEQISKKVWSKKEVGEKIKVAQVLTDSEEGFLISNSIVDTRLSKQLYFNDFAILYRTNAQSRIFEEALRKRNIPYRVYGSISFYQRKEIKDMLAYYRFVVNLKDDEALKRIINYPLRGIGKTSVEKLEHQAGKNEIPIWDVLIQPDKYPCGLNQGIQSKIRSFAQLINGFVSNLDTLDAYDLAFEIAATTGILKGLHNSNSPEELSKYENIQELLNGIKEFSTNPERNSTLVSLAEYLENVTLLTDQDNEKDENRDKVTIMTIHSAKGLEFSHVYVAGVEEDLFPSHLSVSDIRDLEEERRLFYVAITRAKEQVTVSYAQTRYRWGSLINCLPSRFIREIDPQYIDYPAENSVHHSTIPPETRPGYNMRWNKNNKGGLADSPLYKHHGRKFKPVNETSGGSSERTTFDSDDPSLIQVGMEVEHNRFGAGKVIHLDGEYPNIKATVFFQNHGQKQLLLKFAKLKIIKSIE